MEQVINNQKEKNFFEKFCDKFRNFRFYNIVVAAATLLMLISCILLFVFYVTEGGMKPADMIPDDHPLVQFTPFYDQEFVGGMYFVLAIVATIMAIVTIYLTFPYIMNKDKLLVTKSIPGVCFANVALDLVLIVFTIVLIVTEVNYLIVGWSFLIALFALSAIASLLLGLLGLQHGIYIPDIVKKK